MNFLNQSSIAFYGLVLCIFIFFENIPKSHESVCGAEKALCQAAYYPTFLQALAIYPKVKVEAKIEFNKFFVNGTCQTICVLKVVHKIILTLPPIPSPNFTICSTLAAKLTKQKQYCYNGQCLLLSQIAQFFPEIPGIPPIPSPFPPIPPIPPLPTLPPGIPTIPGIPIIG